jgi:trans-2,3-dihydro-3-hydroxyanthranilic acid synthase
MAGIPPIISHPLPTRATLPASLVRWTVRPERAVLIVYDIQSFFLAPFAGPLCDELVHNVALLQKRCAELSMPVAYTAHPGRMTDEQRGLLKDFWGPGMRTDLADREVVPELEPAAADWVLTKWRYSAFHRSDLLAWMCSAGRDQLVLSGVDAHVGVLATALDAFSHDIQSFLVADALGNLTAADHRRTLEYAAQCCPMAVPTEELFS